MRLGSLHTKHLDDKRSHGNHSKVVNFTSFTHFKEQKLDLEWLIKISNT